MKKLLETYLYKNQDFIGKYRSLCEAAQVAQINPSTARKIAVGEQPCTRNGYVFSFHKLTEEEQDKLPIRESRKRIIREEPSGCHSVVEQFEYEVPCDNPTVCALPRNRRDRIVQLKMFIYAKLRDRWRIIPKRQAALEKQYVREILESLE